MFLRGIYEGMAVDKDGREIILLASQSVDLTGYGASDSVYVSLQYADVELELAYLEVFDTPKNELLSAYHERHPRRAGYETRRLFYWLHTALVHVGLFGDDVFCEFTARTAAEIGRLDL